MQLVSGSQFPSANTLQEEARRQLASRDAETVFSVLISFDKIDPAAWLRAQPQRSSDRIFWQGRDDPERVAAVDVALEVSGFPDQNVLDRLGPEVRLYGAARFQSSGDVETIWSAFGDGRFVLPRVELRTARDVSELRIWLAPGEAASVVDAALERLVFPSFSQTAGSPFVAVSRQDTPERARWMNQIERVLKEISSGQIGKVVLARRAELSFEEEIDPLLLLERLIRAAPGAFYAMIPDGKGKYFLTASPERLVRISGGTLQTEALAGTEHVGEGGGSLQDNGKDVREHAFVEDAVMEAIAPFCSEIEEVEAPSLFQAAHVHHLRTPITGTLLVESRPPEIVRALHPTPAVGGTPTDAAVELIPALEGFDRGLYAGPVGWISRDEADLAVGIRSGLVDGRELVLHSGAGIVDGSIPAAEWDETELKLGAFLKALDVGS